jgi:hypothetical protein
MWRCLPLLSLMSCTPIAGPLVSPAEAGSKSTLAIPGLDKLCPTRVSGEGGGKFVVEQGFVEGAGATIPDARQRATETLIGRVCSGLSEVECASVRRHVGPWGDGYDDKKKKLACGSVSLDKSQIPDRKREAQELEVAMRALAVRVAEQSKGSPVLMEAPKWASGCSSGVVGQAVKTQMLVQLGKVEGITLARANQRATRLELSMAPGPAGVTVAAGLQAAGGAGVPLPGFSFPRALFNVPEDEKGECRGNAALGLSDGHRVGSSGLGVEVALDGVDGQACDGTQTALNVRVTEPSRVQLYSIAKDGRSYLVFDGEAQGESSPATFTLTAMPDDETLMAVAVPTGGNLGAPGAWDLVRTASGLCEVPRGIQVSDFPGAAAISTFTYRVVPGGTEGCKVDPSSAERLQQAHQALASAEPCR